MDEFMVAMHRIDKCDIKLPHLRYYRNVAQLSGAFLLHEYDPQVYED